MRKLCTLLLAVNLQAANTLSIGNFPAQAKPGQNIVGQITQTLVTAQPAAGIQFTIVTSADAAVVSVTPATGAVAAGKQILCGTLQNGLITCLVYGLNATTLGNTTIATVNIQIVAKPASSTLPVSISSTAGPFEADAAANPIPVIVGPPGAIGISSRCDVNSDGLINAVDVAASARAELGLDPNPNGYTFFSVISVISAVLGTPCSL